MPCPSSRKRFRLAASSLRGLETQVIERLHERVYPSSRGKRTIRSPLRIFLLALRPEGLAHRVSREIESLHLVDAMQVHAPLHEQVLAPRLHVSVFLSPFPVQGRHAIVKVCEESAESLVADNLEVSEEAVVDVFAIFQIDAA